MSKILQFKEDALKSILKGVRTLAKAVVVTLGPRGRNVMIGKEHGFPVSTKDGVTVAKEITLKDKFENIGAQLVKEAASKAADAAGDGTTTAIVLAEAIFSEGMKNVAAGADPGDIKRGINRAVEAVNRSLETMATQIQNQNEIAQIAAISANNDSEIGAMVAEAMQKVGKDGIVTIGEAKGLETVLEIVEGMQFDKGYVSPYFITNAEKMSVEFDNARILITDQKISSTRQLLPILEKTMEKGSRPLLIIAEDVDADALAMLVVNKVKGSLPVCAVKAPGFGDRRKAILEDIAILTGALLVSEETGYSLETVDIEALGTARKVRITKDDTTVVDGGGQGEAIRKRRAQIKYELENSTSTYDKQKLEERLAKLSGGVAVINVGAVTEAEANEKKDRIEDALHATRAAVAEGVVPGGGVALIRAMKSLDSLKLQGDEAVGVDIVRKSLYIPASAIAANCGKNGQWVAEKIAEKSGAWGYNGLTDQFADLVQDGVLDPVFVTKSALTNAASVASMLLTVAAIVTDKPEPKKKEMAPARGPSPMDMGGMGGMGGGMMDGMGMM
jgi:chaperonin GroEL